MWLMDEIGLLLRYSMAEVRGGLKNSYCVPGGTPVGIILKRRPEEGVSKASAHGGRVVGPNARVKVYWVLDYKAY